MSTIKTEQEWEALGLGLAGRQLVVNDNARDGDIVVMNGVDHREKAWSTISYHKDVWRIYRRIPVPHAGDLDGLPPTGSNGHLVPTDSSTDKAKTYDDGKPPLANLPWAAIRELSMVQLYGAQKYNDYNNYRKGMEITRNLSCALRHISEYVDGRDNDPESGRSHLGHALCRISFVLQNLADGTAIDDRYKKESAK